MPTAEAISPRMTRGLFLVFLLRVDHGSFGAENFLDQCVVHGLKLGA